MQMHRVLRVVRRESTRGWRVNELGNRSPLGKHPTLVSGSGIVSAPWGKDYSTHNLILY